MAKRRQLRPDSAEPGMVESARERSSSDPSGYRREPDHAGRSGRHGHFLPHVPAMSSAAADGDQYRTAHHFSPEIPGGPASLKRRMNGRSRYWSAHKLDAERASRFFPGRIPRTSEMRSTTFARLTRASRNEEEGRQFPVWRAAAAGRSLPHAGRQRTLPPSNCRKRKCRKAISFWQRAGANSSTASSTPKLIR